MSILSKFLIFAMKRFRIVSLFHYKPPNSSSQSDFNVSLNDVNCTSALSFFLIKSVLFFRNSKKILPTFLNLMIFGAHTTLRGLPFTTTILATTKNNTNTKHTECFTLKSFEITMRTLQLHK